MQCVANVHGKGRIHFGCRIFQWYREGLYTEQRTTRSNFICQMSMAHGHVASYASYASYALPFRLSVTFWEKVNRFSTLGPYTSSPLLLPCAFALLFIHISNLVENLFFFFFFSFLVVLSFLLHSPSSLTHPPLIPIPSYPSIALSPIPLVLSSLELKPSTDASSFIFFYNTH